jgi:hypothetical protein
VVQRSPRRYQSVSIYQYHLRASRFLDAQRRLGSDVAAATSDSERPHTAEKARLRRITRTCDGRSPWGGPPVVETTTSATWHQLRDHLEELHLGTFTGPAGTYRQRTELTKPQRDILAKLDLTPPKKIIELAATPARPARGKPKPAT